MPFFLMLVITAGGCFIAWAFTALRKARIDVEQTWKTVEETLADRATVVTRVVDLISPLVEGEVASRLQKSHFSMSTVTGPRSTEAADSALRATLSPIMEKIPASMGMEEIKVQLNEANAAVDRAAGEYNSKVDEYESVRNSSGKSLFAEMLGFTKMSRYGRLVKVDLLDPLQQPALL